MTSNVKNTLKRKMFAHFNTRRKRGLKKKLLCNTVKLWYTEHQKNIIVLRKALESNEYSSFATINLPGFMQLVGWISNRRMCSGIHTLAKKVGKLCKASQHIFMLTEII